MIVPGNLAIIFHTPLPELSTLEPHFVAAFLVVQNPFATEQYTCGSWREMIIESVACSSEFQFELLALHRDTYTVAIYIVFAEQYCRAVLLIKMATIGRDREKVKFKLSYTDYRSHLPHACKWLNSKSLVSLKERLNEPQQTEQEHQQLQCSTSSRAGSH